MVESHAEETVTRVTDREKTTGTPHCIHRHPTKSGELVEPKSLLIDQEHHPIPAS